MVMDPHQDADIPTLTITDAADSNTTAVNHSISTTNGHVDTGLKKKIEALNSDAIKVEPSFEEGEERADDVVVSPSASSDDGDGLHDVPLNNDRPNVCSSHLPPSAKHREAQNDFQGIHAINEHQAPSDRIPNHDTNGHHPEPVSSTTADVSSPYFCLLQTFSKKISRS